MRTAHVQVIVPAYNAEKTVADSLRSILCQTYSDLKVIVVDDGSTDGTASIVSSLAKMDDRICLLRQNQKGIVCALNAALQRCDGVYVARQDADDLSDPDRIKKQVAYLNVRPDVVAVSGAHREIDGDGRVTGRIVRPTAEHEIDFHWAPAREPRLTQPFMMVRREAMEKIGGYRPFTVSEDTDLYWRLLRLGQLEILHDIVGSYRMHHGSISSASILNGRMMAVCSQLGALSMQRFSVSGRDMPVTPVSKAEFEAATTVDAMIRLAAPDALTPQEKSWFNLAVAGKLMELSGYRPYEIESSDCRFIQDAWAGRMVVTRKNRREMKKMLAATSARMVRLRRFRDARLLSSLPLWPEVLARIATGRLYWTKHLQ